MKKTYIPKILTGVGVILFVGFIVQIVNDYMKYDSAVDSAPFSVFVAVRAVEFLVPMAILFVLAAVIRKKK